MWIADDRRRLIISLGALLAFCCQALASQVPPCAAMEAQGRVLMAETYPDHGAMNHGAMNHGAMNHGAMNHGAMNHGAMNYGSEDHGSVTTIAMDAQAAVSDCCDHAQCGVSGCLSAGAAAVDGLFLATRNPAGVLPTPYSRSFAFVERAPVYHPPQAR